MTDGISILVYDLARSRTKPQAVLTGDTLFIGDMGRPDLLASVGVTADELADMLYDSITTKLVEYAGGFKAWLAAKLPKESGQPVRA